MSINNRWFQLCASLVAMIMIANLQYAWTLFTIPLTKALGVKLSAVQLAFTLFILFETWLVPFEGYLIDKLGIALDDFDLIEINEAFAAQVLADGNELGFDWDRVNVNGGAIALGHPIGASGARVLTTLLYELRRRGGKRGLATLCQGNRSPATQAERRQPPLPAPATLCLGGGGAVALAVETV